MDAYSYLRSKFVAARQAHKLIKKFDLKFKYGPFNAKEAEIARKAICEFFEKRNYTMEALQSHLAEETPFPFLELVAHVVKNIEHRTYKAVHTHIAFVYHPLVTNKFCIEDDIRLLRLVQERGFQWKEIGKELEKYRDRCRQRYLLLKGEKHRYLTVKLIKEIIEQGIPTSEREWENKALEIGITKDRLKKNVIRYLRSVQFNKIEAVYSSVLTCAYVLGYNYYCAMSINIKHLLLLLRGEDKEDILDVALKEQNKQGNNQSEDDKSDTRDSSLREDFLKLFNACCNDTTVDLSIDIDNDDIFWDTISREVLIEQETLKNRFKNLTKAYNLRTFKDLFELLESLSYECYVSRIRESILSSMPKK